MIQLGNLSLEKLYSLRGRLMVSGDVGAGAALRMVETEIRLRRRSIREFARPVVLLPSRAAAPTVRGARVT